MNYDPSINDFLSLINHHSMANSIQPGEIDRYVDKFLHKQFENVVQMKSSAELRELCNALYKIPILHSLKSQNEIFDRILNCFELEQLLALPNKINNSRQYVVDEYTLYASFIVCYCLIKKAVVNSIPEIVLFSDNLSLDDEEFYSIPSSEDKTESFGGSFFKPCQIDNEQNNYAVENQSAIPQIHRQLGAALHQIQSYFSYSYSAQIIDGEIHRVFFSFFSNLLAAISAFLMEFGDDKKSPLLHNVATCLIDYLSNQLILTPKVVAPSKAFIANKIFIRRFLIAARISDPIIVPINSLPESALSIANILRGPNVTQWSPDATKLLISMADSVISIQTALALYKLPEQLVYYTSLPTFHYLLPQKNQISILKNSTDGDEERLNIFRSLLRPSIMSVSTMNDPEEGYYIQDYLAGNLEKQRVHHNFWWNENVESDYIYNTNVQAFCRCFSPAIHKDDLSMWEIYGDRAQGCCAVVNCDMSNLSKEELFQICYCDCSNKRISLSLGSECAPGSLEIVKEQIKSLRKVLQQLKAMGSHFPDLYSNMKRTVRQLLLGIAYLFKDASYAHEKEIRYLKYYISDTPQDIHDDIEYIERSYSDGKMPLLCIASPFQLVFDEVMLGPKVQDSNIAAAYLEYSFFIIRKYASDNNQAFKAHTTKITKSKIKYR